MERRNRSLEALKELKYIDTLDSEERAQSLQKWVEANISNNEKFDLELDDKKVLSELYYKSIAFMKKHRSNMKQEIDNHKKIREFLK